MKRSRLIGLPIQNYFKVKSPLLTFAEFENILNLFFENQKEIDYGQEIAEKKAIWFC